MPGVKRVYAYQRRTLAKRRRSKGRTTIGKSRSKYTMSKWKASPSLGYSAPRSTPIATRMRTKLTYFQKGSLDPAAGGIAADQVFRLNSLYDVDLTGVGHQPAGFDELMNLYKYYAVVGADCHISFQNTDTSNDSLCVANVSNFNTATTDVQPIIENGRCNFQWLGIRGSSRDCTDMKLAVSIPVETGTKDVLDNQDLWGTSTTDPTNQLYLHVTCQPNSANNAGVVGYVAILTFDVMFFEPKIVASS